MLELRTPRRHRMKNAQNTFKGQSIQNIHKRQCLARRVAFVKLVMMTRQRMWSTTDTADAAEGHRMSPRGNSSSAQSSDYRIK